MGLPVITVASGGLPVVEATAGMPVTEVSNGRGVAVTKVIGKQGLPVTFETIGVGPGGGGGFATWDAATVTSVTLSGSNLIATNTGTTSANQGARIADAGGKTSGKYYFEVIWTTIQQAGGNFGIGVGTTASTYTNMGNGGTTGIINYRGGSFYSNGSSVSVGTGTWAADAIAGIAVDLDNRRFWTRLSPAGIWNGNAANNPATNVGGYTIPAGTMVSFVTFGGTGGLANNVLTANFGASAFSGAVPSGFTAGWPA